MACEGGGAFGGKSWGVNYLPLTAAVDDDVDDGDDDFDSECL